MVSGKVENTANSESVDDTSPEVALPGGEEQTIIPKPSRAVSMWLMLIVVVLVLLGFMTHSEAPISNFLVETDATAVGAKVNIDGTDVGTVRPLNAAGVQLFGVRTFVHSGYHKLAVSKSNFKSFERVFNLNGEDYMNVALQPLQAPAAKGSALGSNTIQLPGPSANPKDGQTIQLPGPSN